MIHNIKKRNSFLKKVNKTINVFQKTRTIETFISRQKTYS